MRNTIFSNIINLQLNQNSGVNTITVYYEEDLEAIGEIKPGANGRCNPYLDTKFGRLTIHPDTDFPTLEKQILSFMDKHQAICRTY